MKWNAHVLGPVARWPQTLRTALNLCLSSGVPACIFWGRDHTCFYNDAFASIVGAQHPAALGAPGPTVCPELWIQQLEPLLKSVAQTGASADSADVPLALRRDGQDGRAEEGHVRFSLAPLRLGNGSLGGFFTTAIEVTDRGRNDRRLREGSAQLRFVTDNAPVLLAQIDREHRYTFVNRPYAARYRLEPQDIIGRPIAEVIGGPADQAMCATIDAAFAGETVNFELEIDSPEPRLGPRREQVTCTPERALDGAVVGLLIVVVDITTREQAERDLQQAQENALACSRTKDAFLAAISHELRTPLNPVLLLASEAAANPALPAAVRADFDAIRKNVDLEARLIDDLLDLTRITDRKLPLDLRVLNLHTALMDALSIVRPELATKHLVLDLDLRAAEPIVWGDEARLQQVFWNVLKNAVKFTPEAGRITVQTESDPARGLVIVKVNDTGIGMTADEQTRIFETFAQGEHASPGGAHRYGGIGLGLAISRIVVEMHSGRIQATSAGQDCGSDFTIELPLHHAPVRRTESGAAWPLTSAPLVPAPKAAPVERVRVLLVEDHVPTRNTLAQLLGRRHYDVLAAGSVAEARVFGATDDFQLIISDIGLPDGDGYELMSELRATRPNLPGIAITGYGMEDDFARSRRAGFGLHLIKPINIAALEAAIACVFQPGTEINGAS